MSDVLLVLGLVCLVVAGFLFGIITGLVILGVSCVLLSLALSDGKGISWRT